MAAVGVREITAREITALGEALAGEKFSLDDLRHGLSKMVENLASSLGDRKKARRIFLESCPEDVRPVFEALLPRPKRGRAPDRPADRLGRTQLLTVWEIWSSQNGSNKTEFDAFFQKWSGRKLGKGSIVRRLNLALQKSKQGK